MPFTLQNVSYDLQEYPILKDISFSFNPGMFYGVLGPNGSGKTSLLDLLIGYKKPTSGDINYKNEPLNLFSKKILAREVALVPQDLTLNFPFTVEEIVCMGRYPHIPRFGTLSSQDQEIVDQSMAVTGTVTLRNKYITQLSGGEKQRVIFARALAQETPVLLLDEATSNLDVKYGLRLLKYVQDMNNRQSRTIISVFQDINLAARYCEHILFLKQGRLFAHGPTQEILSSRTLNRVFEVEAKVFFEPYTQCNQVIFESCSEA